MSSEEIIKENREILKQELLQRKEGFKKIMPAAKVMHHNYIGGLLVHTIECVEFAKKNFELFILNLNKDIMIAACILHDMGKIFEYTLNM